MANAPGINQPADVWGHCGFDPNPQWSAIWTSWSSERRAQYLDDLDRVDIFRTDQVIDILQGFPPRPAGSDHAASCLSESCAAVERFRFDVANKLMPPSPTRRELIAWCRYRGVEVPDLLIATANAIDGTKDDTINARVALAPWIPITQETMASKEEKPRRGRPRSTFDRNAKILDAAEHYLFQRAQSGVIVSIPEVARHVAGHSFAEGMKQASIERTLKGRLPIAHADSIAVGNGATPRPRNRRGSTTS